MTTYIFTCRTNYEENEVKFVSECPNELVVTLKQENGKNIWVCGGANLIRQLMEANLIDEYHLSIISTLLGDGIKLFPKLKDEQQLTLVKTRSSNGVTEAGYKKHKT